MKNKNLPQAILFNQGKKAHKGDVSGNTDTEVRQSGMRRIARRTGVAALLTTVALGAGAYGIARNNQVSANQVKADKAEAGKIFSNPGPGLTVSEGAPTASVPVAEPVTPIGEATAPAAAPTEGAWTPTPGADTPSPESYQGQSPDTGGLPAEPAGPETGGVASK